MADRTEPIRLIYTTFGTLEDAEHCGGALVERRLAACVNILPRMVSIYEWQGELSRDDEVVMLVKTRAGRLAAALEALAELHPYEVPAMITLAPEAVNVPYADWLRGQTAS
ncbi:divalent-cation tolerance protein CutA [Microbaculum sp. FT89]|uniref:divalent-cation tolerance protein CutA n=1 Tax=Microbaculum sp. FT89 TaxID=3447298 RepID=UPI003F53C61C